MRVYETIGSTPFADEETGSGNCYLKSLAQEDTGAPVSAPARALRHRIPLPGDGAGLRALLGSQRWV